MSDSDFQQQRLKAWQPLLTPLYIVITFLSVGVLFCIIGAVVLSTTSKVTELSVRYDDLPLPPSSASFNSSTPSNSSSTCNPSTAVSSPTATCFALSIPTELQPPIFVYYKLTNFYQNHRRYVKSRSDGQLQGMSSPPFTTCEPLASNPEGEAYYPCGLIAASTFNDTINATLCTDSSSSCTDLSSATFSDPSNPSWMKRGIAWPSDVEHKFKRTTPSYPYTNTSWDGRPLPDVEDEDFIVWMRTSGLPTFKKLYRQITDRSLPAGSSLVFSVDYQFPTQQYGGQKYVVLSTTSWMGGKNDFLGITYVAVGVACVLVAAVFGVKQLFRPRKLGEIGGGGGGGGGGWGSSGEAERWARSRQCEEEWQGWRREEE